MAELVLKGIDEFKLGGLLSLNLKRLLSSKGKVKLEGTAELKLNEITEICYSFPKMTQYQTRIIIQKGAEKNPVIWLQLPTSIY